MCYHVSVEPMPNNPARDSRIGDKSGHWRVIVEDHGTGSAMRRNPSRQVHSEGIPYQQAFTVAHDLQVELNGH